MGGVQAGRALRNLDFGIRPTRGEIEHLCERVSAAFGDYAENVPAITRKAIQLKRKCSAPLGDTAEKGRSSREKLKRVGGLALVRVLAMVVFGVDLEDGNCAARAGAPRGFGVDVIGAGDGLPVRASQCSDTDQRGDDVP